MINPSKGQYLIYENKKSDVFLIWVCVDLGGRLVWVCVNKAIGEIAISFSPEQSSKIEHFNTVYGNRSTYFNEAKIPLPVLDGGQASDDGFVLHTNFRDQPTKKHMDVMYNFTPIDDFFSHVTDENAPQYILFVKGYHEFSALEQTAFLVTDNWHTRTGLHAISYGINANAKATHIDILRKPEKTEAKVGGFDLGALMSGLMGIMQEAMPSMMHATTYSYLFKQNPQAAPEELHQATRMAIAVSETETNKVADIYMKHTKEETQEMYEKAFKGGFEFNLLREFDKRTGALKALGLNPIIYDFGVMEMMKPTPKPKAQSNAGSRALSLEQRLNQLAAIAKEKGASGAKE